MRLRQCRGGWPTFRLLYVGCMLVLGPTCGKGGTVLSAYSVGTANSNTGAAGYLQGAHSPLPQILNAGGSVMLQPKLQVVTLNNDTQAATWEAFVAALPASAYWKATTQEYGVGAAVAATPLHASLTVSGSLTDGVAQRGEASDIELFLSSQLDGATPAWGKPTANTLYIVFLPTGVIASDGSAVASTACADGVLAWHTAMLLPLSQIIIPYVMVLDCGPVGQLSAQDSRTLAASHAIVAAVTDPHLDAFGTFDPDHLHWSIPAGGPEISAACVAALYGDASLAVKPADFPFTVQRIWSNAAAAAGHDPCVPAPQPATAPYFASVPQAPDKVTAPLGANLLSPSVTTAGLQLMPGATAEVPLDLFSDAALSEPWQVAATEMNTQNANLTLSATQGNNGDRLTLTVAASMSATGQSIVRITSSLDGRQHSHYLLVRY